MRKPDAIIYGTDENPPAATLMLLSAQHAFVVSIFLVVPLVVARTAHLAIGETENFVKVTMLGIAISTLLQIRRFRGVGSGLLAIPAAQSSYVPGSIIAAGVGGMPMVAGLLLMSACIELALSRFLRHLRGVLPAELSGLIVLVTGLGVAQGGMDNIISSALAHDGKTWLPNLLVSAGSVAVMVGCSVWGRGPVRTLGAMGGLIAGYLASLALGLVEPAALAQIGTAPLLQPPTVAAVWPAFSPRIILPALISAVVITLNSIGALTAAQRLADRDWKRQDIDGLARGLFADSIGTIVSAAMGASGVSASGSSVSLTAAARATSRSIGYGVALIFVVLAFVPKFTFLVITLPQPVLGAAQVFLSCALLISGITMMSSRLLDTRKTFVLGIAFAFAVGTPALSRAGGSLPDWMAPVVVSPLLASALVALLLNPLLRIGIRQTSELVVRSDGLQYDAVTSFVGRAGAGWGARRDVIERAQGSLAECLDTLLDTGIAGQGARLILGFNELALDARIIWQGPKLTLSERRPTKAELLDDDDAIIRMAGYVISRLASKVSSGTDGVTSELHLVFDH